MTQWLRFGKTIKGAVILAALFTFGWVAQAQDSLVSADVIFIGEQHDNSHHHAVQANYVRSIAPKVLVFEMLTPEQAKNATPEVRNSLSDLEAALEWEASGWPDFSMYYPIFSAAPDALIVGAGVPRSVLRAIVTENLARAADQELVSRFKLDESLPNDQQAAREALQRESHCNALPEEMLPGMVNVQRLRDAMLAEAALSGLEQVGGPVVVITGNGHARTDWGAPFLLQTVAPDVSVHSIGQGEDGTTPLGIFSIVEHAPGVDRGDPCDAFR